MKINPLAEKFFKNLVNLIKNNELAHNVTLEEASFASRANLSTLLFYYLKKNDLINSLDERVRRGLYRDYTMIQADYLYSQNELFMLKDFFEAMRIPALVIKGGYTRRFYPDPSLRFMADYDFVIKRENYKSVIKAFTENGFELVRSGEPFKEKIGTGVTFRSPDLHKFVDLHVRLFQWFRYPYDEKKMWDRAIEVGPYFFYPSIEDQFVITGIHLIKDAFILPASGLMDLYFLSSRINDWDYVNYQIKKSGVKRGFYSIKVLLKELLDLEIPLNISSSLLPVKFFHEEKLTGFERFYYAFSTINNPRGKVFFAGAYILLSGAELIYGK